MQSKVTFLYEAVKALGATKSALCFFEREPQCADELDFQPFVDAMLTLCREHRRDPSGVASLRTIVEVFELIRPPVRAATEQQVLSGLESVRCYMQWIRETFPDARSRPEKN